MFEVSFFIKKIIYRYGFEINEHEIKKEWLYKKNERENPLFIRNKNNFQINKTAFKEGLKYQNDVNQNVLFLSHLAQNNKEISRLIFSWFLNLNVLSGLTEHNYFKYTARLLKDDSRFKNWISLVLKYCVAILRGKR